MGMREEEAAAAADSAGAMLPTAVTWEMVALSWWGIGEVEFWKALAPQLPQY
jgi:hypothetical protein